MSDCKKTLSCSLMMSDVLMGQNCQPPKRIKVDGLLKFETKRVFKKGQIRINSVDSLAPQFERSLIWGQSAVVTGHWQAITSPHTLIPDEPWPNLLRQSSPFFFQPYLQNACQEWKNNPSKKHVLRNAGDILCLYMHSLSVRTEMTPCTGCPGRFQLCF